jgi:methionine sulfoxide reductase heme-binding subunit
LTLDELLWLTSRTAALTAFFVLAAAVISGQALRTASFDGLIRSRDLSSLHRFLTACWVPFVALHVVTTLLDPVARIGPLDVVVPFRVPYSALAIGLGTVGFDLLLVVVATSYLKRQLAGTAWRWLHRMSYLMFGVFVGHALLSGTDFARPVVLAAAAAVVAFVAIMTFARVVFGRLESVAR